jgi:hypothetical protein
MLCKPFKMQNEKLISLSMFADTKLLQMRIDDANGILSQQQVELLE